VTLEIDAHLQETIQRRRSLTLAIELGEPQVRDVQIELCRGFLLRRVELYAAADFALGE
jgi:hypothetical protein